MRVSPRTIVPWGRIAFGTLCVIAPEVGLRSLLIDPAANPDGPLLMRVFGSRAVVIGALSAGLAGPAAARRGLAAGAVMDLVDAGSMVAAHRAGRMTTPALVVNAGVGVGYAALGLAGARD